MKRIIKKKKISTMENIQKDRKIVSVEKQKYCRGDMNPMTSSSE